MSESFYLFWFLDFVVNLIFDKIHKWVLHETYANQPSSFL